MSKRNLGSFAISILAILSHTTVVVFVGATPAGQDSLAQLRVDIDALLPDSIDAVQFEKLARRTIGLAEAANDPGEKLSVLRQSARLCWEGPAEPARFLREWSLRQLVGIAADSERAQSMIGSQFLPPLHRVEANKQRDEVRAFDQLIVHLTSEETDPKIRANLRYLTPLLRLEVNRAWNAEWLDKAERDRTIGNLRILEAEFLAIGGHDSQSRSESIEENIRELVDLPFGSPAPEFLLADLQEQTFALPEYRGQVVVLSFWSSWCAPCLAMVPHEKEMQDAFPDNRFELIGVSADEDLETARTASRQHSMPWRSVWDKQAGESSLVHFFAIRGLPAAIVLDSEGRICGKFVGSVFNQHFSTADIKRSVESAMGSQPGRATVVEAMDLKSAKATETAETGNNRVMPAGVSPELEELKRYSEVAVKLVHAINTEDKEGYRALFTDEGWDNAIPWWREMFANQISSFGRIETAYSPIRGTVSIGKKMSFGSGLEQGVTLMVKFEERAGGALSFETNRDGKIIATNVYISEAMWGYVDSENKPIFELK